MRERAQEEDQPIGDRGDVAPAARAQVQAQLPAVRLGPVAVHIVDGGQCAPPRVLRVGVPAVEAARLVASELQVLALYERPRGGAALSAGGPSLVVF